MPDRPDLPRKPSRAETARANGARSRGPVTDAGKARSSRNAPAHGLRARSLTPVPALGETRAVLDAHLAAYRRELAHPGPYARDLAEAVACANLRAARAAGLLPGEEEAEAAEAELDAALAELPCPNEPKVEKAEPSQPLAATPGTRGKRPGKADLTRLRRAGPDPTCPGHVGFEADQPVGPAAR